MISESFVHVHVQSDAEASTWTSLTFLICFSKTRSAHVWDWFQIKVLCCVYNLL